MFKGYAEDLDIFKAGPRTADSPSPMARIIPRAAAVIEDILAQTRGQTFDYLVHSAPFLFTKPIAQLLKLPTVSSLAVFAGLEAFVGKAPPSAGGDPFSRHPALVDALARARDEVLERFGVPLPGSVRDLLFNRGDINLVYTSRLFASDITYFDDSYKFVGPPVFEREEPTDFPFEALAGRQVLYISLGTVFGDHSPRLYDVFFEAFADWDGVVVLAAYGVDVSGWAVPGNFIVRPYVPQGQLLAHVDVAVTHCGMNSMSDLLSHEIPFVSLPLGADQPALAARAQALGTSVSLEAATVTAQDLRLAVDTVMRSPSCAAALREVADSFRAAGGYARAVDEIFAMKAAQGIRR